jgi:hypothetical protein
MRLAAVFLFVLFACSCDGPSPQANTPATRPTTATTTTVATIPFRDITLDDVQPLRGGTRLRLAGDGRGIVDAVARNPRNQMIARRYRFTASPQQMLELQQLLDQHTFGELQIPTTAGIPDDARVTITLDPLGGGAPHAVAKWASDPHPDFDPVYVWLLDLADRARRQQRPQTEQPYDGGPPPRVD